MTVNLQGSLASGLKISFPESFIPLFLYLIRKSKNIKSMKNPLFTQVTDHETKYEKAPILRLTPGERHVSIVSV